MNKFLFLLIISNFAIADSPIECFAKAKDYLQLDDAVTLCAGAKSIEPLHCFMKAKQLLGSNTQAAELCAEAESLKQVIHCYRKAIQETGSKVYAIQLCSNRPSFQINEKNKNRMVKLCKTIQRNCE